MPLSLKIQMPSEALFAYAEDAFLADPWAAVKAPFKSALYDTIIEKLPKGSPISILDIGCGNGGLAERLAQGNQIPNVSYKGIDLSQKLVSQAKSKNLSSNYDFEVQNVYEYMSQNVCDWDFVISSMFLYGFDPSSLQYLNSGVARHARKGYIIAAGIQEKQRLESLSGSNATIVAGEVQNESMVVVSKIFNLPKSNVPTFYVPLRASIIENGEYNYALAVIQQKKTGNFPATVQGAIGAKNAGSSKLKGNIVTSFSNVNVTQKLK